VWEDNKAMIQLFLELVTEPKRELRLRKLLVKAALDGGRSDYMEMVLDKGPLPELTESFGSELLYDALTVYKPNELDEAVVELLVEKGAKPTQGGEYGKERILHLTKFDKQWLAEKIPSLFTD
jgi:hypothetical protein